MIEKRLFEMGDCCRIAAGSVLILSPFLSFVLLHEITLKGIVGMLAAACVILTVMPAVPPDRALSCRVLLAQGVAALLPIPLSLWAGEKTLPAFYMAAVAGPAVAIHTVALLRTAGNRAFLSMELPGWEAMLILVRQSYFFCPIVKMAFAWSVSEIGGAVERGVLWYAAVSLAVMLAVCIVRSVTHQSLLPFRFGADLPGKSGKNEILRPHAPGRLNVSQRMLFEKVGRYMDERQPYLKDTFSLDEMAHALLTNKSYLSKVINISTGLNFSQFVNNYRVRYAVELFRRDTRLKVSELSVMSGFHNGVTFNLAFNLFIGSNPSDWCRQYRERAAADQGALSRKRAAEP